jgi:anti-sigma-K factor RskA
MEQHDLTAAYALDALEPQERREFEQHLAGCERCRDELAGLQEAAGALAFAVDAPPPPPALRQRILEQARGERQNVVPLRRQPPFRLAVAAASLAAAAAVALAFWATSLSGDLDRERAAARDSGALIALLSDESARRVPVSGVEGTLVVSRSGRAALVLEDVRPAPRGKAYEAWVMKDGQVEPAGLFDSRDGRAAVVLDEPVPEGATVAVTVEDDEGAEAPTTEAFARATA